MTLRVPPVVLLLLAGCAAPHRLVAPLAYEGADGAAARSDDAFGAPPDVASDPVPICIEWKRVTLSNGIPLYVAERHAFPSAAIRIVLTTGAMASGDLTDGSAKRLDLLAATYLRYPYGEGEAPAPCTRASCWIAGRVSAGAVGDGLERLAFPLIHPNADGRSAIHRFIAAADAMRREEDNPWLTLRRNAEVMAFGRRPAGPHDGPMAEPTLADVTQARDQICRPEATTLVVAGDVSFAEVQAQAERVFGGWRSDGASTPPAALRRESSDPTFAPRVVYVPSHTSASAVAAIVARGPAPSDPDFWAYRVAVDILGGGWESELFVHVREEMAAAYVPTAEVRWFPGASVVTLGGYLESGKVIAATRVMVSSVRALREQGPGLRPLERAKARLNAELRGSVSTNALLASSLEVIGADVHPVDPCQATARIDAVTPDNVRAVMRAYFAERRLGVVVIAREDQLDAWPADLDMGAVQRRDWLGQDIGTDRVLP
jgi:zinc protease